MKIRIEHKNKVVEFNNVPGKVVNSIETLLSAIAAEESEIMSSTYLLNLNNKKKRVAKAARELDPIVNACPCSKCSDDIRMTCNKCDEYYDWIDRLKGE